MTRNKTIVAKGYTKKEVNKVSKLTAAVYKYNPTPSLSIIEISLSLFSDHQGMLSSFSYLHILFKSCTMFLFVVTGIRGATLLLKAQTIKDH